MSVEDDFNDDPDWNPENEDLLDFEHSPTEQDRDTNPAKERKFIVYEFCLDTLLQTCTECGLNCKLHKNIIGSYLQVNSICEKCCQSRKWESQPTSNSLPLGNLIIAGAVLFSGGSANKFITICNHESIQMFSIATYMNIQTLYRVPTINDVWGIQQASLFGNARFTGEPLRLGSDGRCCSPGHTANYLSYTLMDLKTNKILDTQLVQVIYNHIFLRFYK